MRVVPRTTCGPPRRWKKLCPDLAPGYSPKECHQHLQRSLPKWESSSLVGVAIIAPVVLLQCLSFCWGKKLHDALCSGQVIHQAVVVLETRRVLAQPLRP
mmetsp:Transcript_16282/g.38229  ORF Transcript_16282/g.38229 Transcript_16282/m.38229 type:complete len:100 (-) Transcript_16282:149-448(-)